MDDEEQLRPRAEWLDQFVARTQGPVGVHLSPEQEVDFPVEVFAEHGPGFVGSGTLGLSQRLEDDLIEWLRWWQRHVSLLGDEVVAGDDADWERWGRHADALRQRLQSELGRDFRVRLD